VGKLILANHGNRSSSNLIVPKKGILAFLKERERNDRCGVISKLSKGDMIPTGEKIIRGRGIYPVFYEIDEPEIFRQVQNFCEGHVSYWDLHKSFNQSLEGGREFFLRHGKRDRNIWVAPYSVAFSSKSGACLETAIAVQLTAQQYSISFLVIGLLLPAHDGQRLPSPGHLPWQPIHAYNLILERGRWYLFDAAFPVSEKSQMIIEVSGIKETRRELLSPLEDNRRYFLYSYWASRYRKNDAIPAPSF